MSDGGENVRRMQEYLHPFSEHLIDCFHITMRLTVLQQQTKGLKQEQPQAGEDISKRPASVKHLLWHGNTEEALERSVWVYYSDGEGGFYVRFLQLTLLFASSIPVFATAVSAGTSDTFHGGQCANYGSSSASCFNQSIPGGDGYGQQKGAISMVWNNPLQIEVKGWYYEWYSPSVYTQYSPVGRTTDALLFSIPATWGNYVVTGFVHDQFNTSDYRL